MLRRRQQLCSIQFGLTLIPESAMPSHKPAPLTATDGRASQHSMVPQTPVSTGRQWTVFRSQDFDAGLQPESAATSTSNAAELYSHNPAYAIGSPGTVKFSSATHIIADGLCEHSCLHISSNAAFAQRLCKLQAYGHIWLCCMQHMRDTVALWLCLCKLGDSIT